jgi:hypothetical protein
MIFLAPLACSGRTTRLPPALTPAHPATVVVAAPTLLAVPTRTPTAVASPLDPTVLPPLPPTTAPPSATPVGRIGPAPLPAGLNPLTGEVAPDPALLAHRPLAVKIVNEPACARPQYGLEQAAVVFEHYVEAWGTRFTAVYYGQAAGKLGGVRSARLIDLELPAIFDAIFVFSGSSGGVKARLQASDFADRIIASEWQATCPPLCRVPVENVPCADLEHTLFTTLPALWAQAAQAGLDQPPRLSGWAFSAVPLSPGQPASAVHVGYASSPVDWRYEPANGRYHRWQDGVRHVAAETHQRLTASNVVVLFAHHAYSDIRESTNFYSLEIQFWGQGHALVFRDGQVFETQWVRAERSGLFQLVDTAGAPLPLKPGRTWFEFVPLDAAVTPAEAGWTVTAPVLPQQTPPRP